MIKFKFIFRSLLRQKLNTGIIIASLAIGMACVNLIAMFIQRELNTDGFHVDKDRIYALTCDYKRENVEQEFECGKGAAEYIKSNFSQVEDFCRISGGSVPKVLVNNDAYFDRPVIIEASKNFFGFFTYKLLTNNPKTALEAKNNLIISEDLAHKYFGSGNAVGQVITLVNGEEKEPMVVSGIFRKPVDNSQLNFEMVRLLPEGYRCPCYVKLKHNADPEELETILKANKDIMPGIQAGVPGLYHLKSLGNFYFDDSISWMVMKRGSRDINDLWIALVIGLVIMCIATFNYLGLLNNNLLEKNKAYAIQRVNGGSKFGFVLNFMTESLVVVGLSFFISLLLMLWMAPFYNGLTSTNITASFIFRPQQILILSAVVALLLITTFLFVSFRISTNINFNILKPSGNQIGKRIQFPAFNIFQLASSIILIIISAVIVKQTNFITNKPIGLDKNVIEVKIPIEYSSKISAFGEELIANSSIAQVSKADGTPVMWYALGTLKFKENGVEKEVKLNQFHADQNYFSTVGIQIIEGTGFSGNPSEDMNNLLINESLARLFPGQNLIGTRLPGFKRVITGIVKDFQYLSLKLFVEPASISYDPTGSHLLVKPSKNQIAQAHLAIAKTWKKFIPDYPLDIETIGDQYEWLHRENKNYLQLIGACCFISVFLSMIGLFAISFQSSRYRTKEIGIRKVNGARISEVMVMLSKNFVKWVVVAFVIATPIAWYAMHKWLENFAYKTELSWWIFALAGLLALGIALLTVSWQSWKAATRNPVEALRHE